jgi:hypothetical protein
MTSYAAPRVTLWLGVVPLAVGAMATVLDVSSTPIAVRSHSCVCTDKDRVGRKTQGRVATKGIPHHDRMSMQVGIINFVTNGEPIDSEM